MAKGCHKLPKVAQKNVITSCQKVSQVVKSRHNLIKVAKMCSRLPKSSWYTLLFVENILHAWSDFERKKSPIPWCIVRTLDFGHFCTSHLGSSYLMYVYPGLFKNIPHAWSIIDTLYNSSLNVLTLQMKVVQIEEV